MHQKRNKVSKKIPVIRKGTKYVARSSSHLNDSVPVVVALRDMLKLAKTTKEVKKMIHQKLLKINGRNVKDHRESIKLFNLLKADKNYILSLTSNGRFAFDSHSKKERPCKIINKTLTKKNSIQLNLHDGSNIITKDKAKVNDTIYLSPEGKITSHFQIEKGKDCVIIKGKYLGKKGKIESTKDNIVKVKFDKDVKEINIGSVIAI